MKRRRTAQHPDRLDALARQATDYALHMMRTTGSVPATVIATLKAARTAARGIAPHKPLMLLTVIDGRWEMGDGRWRISTPTG